MRGFVVVPFTPSDPTWPALLAASLTSVDGQRDPCIVLSNLAAYVREGDDLGGAQRLAVIAVDFGRWSQRASRVGFAPPCGWHAEHRPLQSLQSEWTPRNVSAPRRRSRGSASWGAGKTGADERCRHNIVTQGILGLHLDRQRAGPYRGTLAQPGVLVTSRAGPGLDFYGGDKPGGIRKRQSVTHQSDRFKLGPARTRGTEWSRSTTLPVFVSPNCGGRLGCRGISDTILRR